MESAEQIKTLWKEFTSGNEEAFYKLYDLYVDVLFSYASHFTSDQHFIKDCIQDVFFDLFRYRKNLAETDNVKFYLMCAMRRKIAKNKKQDSVFVVTNDIFAYNNLEERSTEDIIIDRETEEEDYFYLNKAIQELNSRQQESLTLKFKYGLTYPEIAEYYNITVESVRTSIYRSLKAIRLLIEKYNNLP